MKNQSIGEALTWSEDIGGTPVQFEEVIRQAYSNMVISAGVADGHPIDTMYFQIKREGDEPIFLLMRPDEIAALAWCLTGALWSEAIVRLPNESDPSTRT